jgi:hypothetical protein
VVHLAWCCAMQCLRRAAGQIDDTGTLLKSSHPSAHEWDPTMPSYRPNCTDPERSMPNAAGRMGWATAGGGPFTQKQWPTKPVAVPGTPSGSKSRSGPTRACNSVSFQAALGGRVGWRVDAGWRRQLHHRSHACLTGELSLVHAGASPAAPVGRRSGTRHRTTVFMIFTISGCCL